MRGKLVCKRKRDDSGAIARYKVWYIAKGYAQQYGVDYDKTTALTARLKSFRIVLHVATSLGWDLQQYDIKTAFLHSVLPPKETAYMKQPPGFEEPGKKDWVMQLNKSIYEMKQASHIWNKMFHKTVMSWGFKQMKNKWCVYHHMSDTETTVVALHVDNIVTTSSFTDETNALNLTSGQPGKYQTLALPNLLSGSPFLVTYPIELYRFHKLHSLTGSLISSTKQIPTLAILQWLQGLI